MTKKILFIFIYIFNFSLHAAEVEIKLYNTNNGLNANFINDAAVDKNENIWLGSNLGLKKFDGYNFINYKIPNHNNKEIRKLSCFENKLYILYLDGHSLVLNLDTGIIQKLSKDKVLDFFVTKQKTVLLKSNFSIEVLAGKKRINYTLKFSRKLPFQDFGKYYAITIYNNAIYFSIPNIGLYQLKKNKIWNIASKDHKTLPTGYRERFKIINHKLFFLGLYRPVYIDSNNKINFYRFLDFNKSDVFLTTDINFKNQHFYYIKNDNSLIMESSGKSIPILDHLQNAELRNFFFHGKTIYITSNKGLYEITPKNKAITHLTLDNRMMVKRKIIEDQNRLLFFCFPSTLSLEGKKISKLNKKISVVYDAIKVKNKFYLTTEGSGLLEADENLKKIEKLNKKEGISVVSVYYDKEDNLVYYGDRKYLYFFTPEQKKIKKIAHPFQGFVIKSIIKDQKNNRLFAGTENGVFILDLKSNKIKKFLPNKLIGDLLIDQNGFLWIGYEAGILVCRLSDLKLIKKISFNSLKNPRVVCLLQDNQNRIWASTYSGIVAYDYKTDLLLEIKNANLLNYEYNHKSACKLKNGKLIFGGLDGYDIIDPSRFNFSKSTISGRISGYHLIKNTDSAYINFSENQTISFRNKNEFVRIYITTNKNTDKQKCIFQYKLDNTHWIDLKQEYIDMVGLAKGTYLLQIRGYDDLGKIIRFSPTEIIVKEDFYKSDLFISILAFITFLLLILIFRVLYNRLKMKNKIYEKISMDLHDEVGTLLSKTALMIAQKDFLETELRNKIQENIKQANFGLRTNINSIKHYDRQLIYIYYECIEVMESFLTVKNIPYHYSFEGRKDKKITKSLYKDLKLCFFEIFNNTIKYSSTNGIEVKFSEKQNELTILITEKNNYLDFSQIDYGNGLKNIKKRMERNHGRVHYISDKEKKAYTVILKIKL